MAGEMDNFFVFNKHLSDFFLCVELLLFYLFLCENVLSSNNMIKGLYSYQNLEYTYKPNDLNILSRLSLLWPHTIFFALMFGTPICQQLRC